MALGLRKVAENLRLSSDPAGGGLTYTIELGGGGGEAKVAQYWFNVKNKSGANVRIYGELYHGADKRYMTAHSDIFGTSGTPASIPSDNVLVGDADTSIIIGEERNLDLTVSDSAATSAQWVIGDLYEMLKAQ